MNSPRPVLPTQLTSSTLRCSHFQKNVFWLRERDLLEQFTCQVAELQGMGLGETREFSFLLNHQLGEDISKAFTEKARLQTVLDRPANSVYSGNSGRFIRLSVYSESENSTESNRLIDRFGSVQTRLFRFGGSVIAVFIETCQYTNNVEQTQYNNN